ncbi:Glutamine--fructose-6-phosphate aminotransferase [isomerizing] [bacterium HR19]|nr:Glutamine--fructose-6-phosphate aminotransferase [isomerizing] [bacterium HR19]
MCGIVGYIGKTNALHVIIPSLQRLEYRGYDSAGIAVIKDGEIRLAKKKGKISELISFVSRIDFPTFSRVGIGHTRWATHGPPSDNNAHPHLECSGKIAVVHNGIIENFSELRKKLEKNHKFTSETDTEVIAHLIEDALKEVGSFEKAFEFAVKQLEGTFAVVSIFSGEPDRILCARYKAPLVIGLWDENGNLVSSDIPSLLIFTKKIIPLSDGEIAIVKENSVEIKKDGFRVERQPIEVPWDAQQAEKSGFKHFMLKEIYEQPHVVVDTTAEFLSRWDELNLGEFQKIIITGCGTSYHAGLLGKLWIEHIAKIPVEVDYASELRYKDYIQKNSLFIAISQSGETADTLEAVRRAKEEGLKVVSLVNVLGSTLSRESDFVLHTNAGPEIGVAATKTFLSQITVLYLLAVFLSGQSRKSKMLYDIQKVPEKIEEVLALSDFIYEISEDVSKLKNALYLGRWISYPVVMEGALKLKEISYIHAEPYPAGEMKHGPIALVSPSTLSVFVAPRDRVFKKTISNLHEVSARHGKVILITTKNTDVKDVWKKIEIPDVEEFLSPFLTVPVLQLLAYHTATILGHDVDQPRNLAKSVTVE